MTKLEEVARAASSRTLAKWGDQAGWAIGYADGSRHPETFYGTEAEAAQHVRLLNARAALEALRVPSDGMVEAGYHQLGGDPIDTRECWTAMLDAILKEQNDDA